MGEQHDIASDIVEDRYAATSDPVLHLRTGQSIRAEIQGEIDPLQMPSDFGDDPRGVMILNVFDDAEAALLRQGDDVQFTLFGRVTRATLIRLKPDPASPQTAFWIKQIVEGKDT